MFDAYDVTSPAQTTKAAPTEAIATLPTGFITHVGVQFPSGCVGLVHARILKGGHQVWPTDPDEDLSSNGFIISWEDRYDNSQPPYDLRLQVWNDDDPYPHTITFFFETAAAEPPGGGAALTLSQRLASLLGR